MGARFVNEKFTEDSDPIHDMGIGMDVLIKQWIEKETGYSYSKENLLWICARYGKLEFVKYLLDRGYDVHEDDDYALQIASENGHTETVKVLLNAGADVHADDDYALQLASRKGHTETVKALLDAGADVHIDDGWALQLAGNRGHTEVVKLLLDAGANVHAYNNSALRRASANEHTEVVKILKYQAAKEKKVVKESVNEKFTEDSDPIRDMNIGVKGLFTKILKYFEENLQYEDLKDDVEFVDSSETDLTIDLGYSWYNKYSYDFCANIEVNFKEMKIIIVGDAYSVDYDKNIHFEDNKIYKLLGEDISNIENFIHRINICLDKFYYSFSSYVKLKHNEKRKKLNNMRAKLINEKFTEDSDPIHDMGIGDPEKTILPLLVRELAKYDIEAEWEADDLHGEGFWYFSEIDLFDEEEKYFNDVQLSYATDKVAKEEDREGGFSLYNDDSNKLLTKITHDIRPIVKKLIQLKYGNKKIIFNKIKKLENKINLLKNVEKLL